MARREGRDDGGPVAGWVPGKQMSDGIAVQDVYKETPWGPTPMEGRGGDRHGQESRAP